MWEKTNAHPGSLHISERTYKLHTQIEDRVQAPNIASISSFYILAHCNGIILNVSLDWLFSPSEQNITNKIIRNGDTCRWERLWGNLFCFSWLVLPCSSTAIQQNDKAISGFPLHFHMWRRKCNFSLLPPQGRMKCPSIRCPNEENGCKHCRSHFVLYAGLCKWNLHFKYHQVNSATSLSAIWSFTRTKEIHSMRERRH